MRIQKRLVLSNMAMILIPMGLIITTNLVLSFMFDLGHDRVDRREMAASYFWPAMIYMLGVAVVLILTNGTLAALVSRSITRPLAHLEARALRIRDGDLSRYSRRLMKCANACGCRWSDSLKTRPTGAS